MKIELLQFIADFPLPNPSPFCMKAETFLRLAGLDYEIEAWSPATAPLGKAPVVRIDGELVADSTCIVRALIERGGLDIDDTLEPERQAIIQLAIRTLEEHTYWVILQHRWLNDEVWNTYRHVIGSAIPAPGFIKPALLWWLRRGVRNNATAQGLARHRDAEIVRRSIEDIEGFAVVLGDGAFLGGDAPCSFDAAGFAFLAQMACHPEHPLGSRVREDGVLMGYIERVKAKTFPEAEFPW